MVIELRPVDETWSGTSGMTFAGQLIAGTAVHEVRWDTFTGAEQLVPEVFRLEEVIEDSLPDAELLQGIDEESLRVLYREFEGEDRDLAEAGLADYQELLLQNNGK